MLTVLTDALEPNGEREIRVRWDAAVGAEAIVSLAWRTTGRARERSQIIATRTLPTPGEAGVGAVCIQLPEGPWSYRGALFGVEWSVEVTPAAGEPVTAVVTVGPGGKAALSATPRQ